jgi:signal transduction histidine kinase
VINALARFKATHHRRAWVAFALVAVGGISLCAFTWANRSYNAGANPGGMVMLAVAGILYAALGALIVSRTSNLLGWVFLAAGGAMVAAPAAEGYALYAVLTNPGALPAPLLVNRLATLPMAFMWSIAMLFQLFPTGRPLSRRWAVAAWGLVGGAVLFALGWIVRLDDAGRAMIPGPWTSFGVEVRNPFAVSALTWVWKLGVGIALACSALGIVSFVLRFRLSEGEERAQLRWLMFVGALILGLFVIGMLLPRKPEGIPDTVGDILFTIFFTVIIVGIPAASAIAIFKYHLYDIDVVISKTVVAALLGVFITVVYVGVVVVVGRLFDGADLALSIAATALVALLFQPARDRAQHLANRLVYGVRATPYEVIAGFSGRVAETVSVDDVLPQMAEAAGTGVGATTAGVRVLVPGTTRDESWPAGTARSAGAVAFPVAWHGETVGEIWVERPRNEPLAPTEELLLRDLAGQAGLALHNVRLHEELAIKVAEVDEQAMALARSRERLVTARDAQRRGLQRDIQEGPERTLRAIGQRLEQVDVRDRGASDFVDELSERTNAALDELRNLARGIFPPLLSDKGIVAALEGHIRKVGAHATIDAAPRFDVTRFDDDVEACVYFCALQAIQNVIRHAGNAPCRVHVHADDDTLSFEISDRGPGFDPAVTARGMGLDIMQDRVDALDGTLTVTSALGAGASIAVRIPTKVVTPA